MRCPNCGAFVEDNKTVCTMCGTPINKDNNQNMGFNTFNNGGGNPFGNTGGFNSNNSNSFNIRFYEG